jgi:hypothetical protein
VIQYRESERGDTVFSVEVASKASRNIAKSNRMTRSPKPSKIAYYNMWGGRAGRSMNLKYSPVYGELLLRRATWHGTLLHPFLYVIDFKRALSFGEAQASTSLMSDFKRDKLLSEWGCSEP